MKSDDAVSSMAKFFLVLIFPLRIIQGQKPITIKGRSKESKEKANLNYSLILQYFRLKSQSSIWTHISKKKIPTSNPSNPLSPFQTISARSTLFRWGFIFLNCDFKKKYSEIKLSLSFPKENMTCRISSHYFCILLYFFYQNPEDQLTAWFRIVWMCLSPFEIFSGFGIVRIF